eukprot:TRINITY_DN3860_c0_g1_i14.p2 TRINITY_DN3860_c0_g1~~TRINITY_DN3860_c0_g1_i14.p2  ORF type:complete len:168 (-),score=45.17 TRINITY_DN3860_c0_g1_i14:77-580(-)
MLLKDLLKVTPSGHPDNKPTMKALQQVKEAAEFLNSEKKKFESHLRVQHISREWNLEKEFSGKRLIHEVELYKGQPTQKHLKRNYYIFFCFSDLIVLAKYKWETGFKQVKRYPISTPVILPPPDVSTVPDCLKVKFGSGTYYVENLRAMKLLRNLFQNQNQNRSSVR